MKASVWVLILLDWYDGKKEDTPEMPMYTGKAT